MNIGILLPRSNAHPGIGIDFMDGLKAFTKQQGLNNDIKFIAESVGFGGSEKEVYARTEKLLLTDDADVIVGFVDEKVIDILKPLMMATGKLFLVVNAGANHPQNWIPQSNIVNLSLQNALLCALTGLLAAEEENKNAVMATTFYDCGYLHLAAMVKQFLKASGNITFNYVNNTKYDDSFEIKAVTDFLSSDKSTASLLCIFDELPASLFYHHLNSFDGAENLKLFVSPMMLQAAAIKNEGHHKFSLHGYLPWHPSYQSEANKNFIDTYSQQTKKEPTIFSLLGWETAMILQQVYISFKDNFQDGAAIAEGLKKNAIETPRGKLKLDGATQYFVAPVIKCFFPDGANKLEMEYAINIENEWEEFTQEPIEGVVSGWTNTYLCY